MFADIIVNVRAGDIDRPLQYRVPADFQGVIGPGSRVIVPLQSRRVEGVVMSLSDRQVVAGVRPIKGLAGDEPPLSEGLLAVAAWLRSVYACRWIDALRAVAPPGWLSAGRGYARVTDGDRDQSLTTIQRRVLERIRSSRQSITGLMRGKDRSMWPVVQGLVRRGLVRIHRPIAGFGRNRVDEFSLTESGRIALATEQVRAGAHRQQALLRELERGTGTAAELARRLGTDPGTQRGPLLRLVELGWVSVRSRPLVRKLTFPARSRDRHQLSPDQERALAAIDRGLQGDGGSYLLYGVTASGKTEVYLEAIERTLALGQSAVYLVPEIAITPQMLAVFAARLGGDRLCVLHSGLSRTARHQEWLRAAGQPGKVVIGARSAILAPVHDPGLFIIDEEHETTYKQQESPRYHARDAAGFRRSPDRVLVLGSATPSLESFYRAERGDIELLRLDRRVCDRPLADTMVVDMREELAAGHRSIFSRALIDSLQETLAAGEQAILFVNRRGYATFVLCRDCGFVHRCPRCELSLAAHRGDDRLRCHLCGYRTRVADQCPRCKGVRIRQFGAGTQRVEEELARLVPGVASERLDRDTASRRGEYERVWAKFARGDSQVLIGTQMVAKGWDLPAVTTVGAVAADVALHHPDFRAAERTFQLLTQVAGRAGRGHRKGRALIQTYNPEHYAIMDAARQDYRAFYEKEIQVRRELGYPPFCRLVSILVSGRSLERVAAAANRLADLIPRDLIRELLGPAPAPRPRLREQYRWQLLLFCDDPGPLTGVLREQAGVQDGIAVTVDVDPIMML